MDDNSLLNVLADRCTSFDSRSELAVHLSRDICVPTLEVEQIVVMVGSEENEDKARMEKGKWQIPLFLHIQ